MSAAAPTLPHQPPPARHQFVLWAGCAALAALLCCYSLSAVLVDGHVVPADHDSFYHAHRILAALGKPLGVMQFDPHIHAPEGSWVTWPWAYDALMAALAGVLMPLSDSGEPLRMLALVAPAWVLLNAALMLAIGRRLALGLPLLTLAMLCFALSPLTRALHRVGMLDHHFVEYSFVLAALWSGLRWLDAPAGRGAAVLCGIVLGAAPAFHNGLFVLQLPLLLTLVLRFALGRALPAAATRAFALALVVTTGLFLLPSEPFRDGRFTFYLHSGFHLYVAGASALVVLALSRLPRGRRGLVVLAVLAAALAAPLLSQAVRGGAFLGGALPLFDQLIETRSLFARIAAGEAGTLSRFYSGLIWLLPCGLLALLAQLRRHHDDAALFFLVFCLFGSTLLLLQLRLQYFGAFALWLSWCVVAQRCADARPRLRHTIVAGLALVCALAYVPALRALGATLPAGGDFQYMLLRDVYVALGRACASEPGIVLAEHGDGHYITYHSDCAVIANNFILTARHERKLALTEALLAATPEDMTRRAPWVRYVLVRRNDNVLAASSCHPGCAQNVGLREALLGARAALPPRFELLYEKRLRRGERVEPLARLFRVHAATGAAD